MFEELETEANADEVEEDNGAVELTAMILTYLKCDKNPHSLTQVFSLVMT